SVLSRAIPIAEPMLPTSMKLTGVYNTAAEAFGRAVGPLGGAILNGWEMLNDGYWRRLSDGLTLKGIRAEDGGYMNPGILDSDQMRAYIDQQQQANAYLASMDHAAAK